jgi:hypothetical protein
MRHNPLIRGLSAAALFLMAGCVSSDAAPTAVDVIPGAVLAAKGGPPPQDSVLLAMTVSDDGALQIGSDGLGEYVNGTSGMAMMIDFSGNLQITPLNANSSTPPERRLDIRYPAGLVHTYPNQWNFKIKSNRTNNGNPRIQDMTVGASLCYNVTIAHRDQQVSYVNTFNAGFPGASYALITRTSATTWSMSSGGVASTGLDCGADNVAQVTGADLTVKRGDFTVGPVSLPFSIALRSLP